MDLILQLFGRIERSSFVPSVPPLSELPSGVGVTLDRDGMLEAPVVGLLPAGVEEEFTLIVSLSSQRASNSFLFSIRDETDRLHFALQLLPGRVVVYTGDRASVYFAYEAQDGRRHSFAVAVRPCSVSFFAHCGKIHYSEETLTRVGTVSSGGRVTVGRMSSRAAQFEGVLCQLEIYPSAQVAAHYCDHVKKNCRLADTFRSPGHSDAMPVFPSVTLNPGSAVTSPGTISNGATVPPLRNSTGPTRASFTHGNTLSSSPGRTIETSPDTDSTPRTTTSSSPRETGHHEDQHVPQGGIADSMSLHRENMLIESLGNRMEPVENYDSGLYGYDYGFQDGEYFFDYESVDFMKGDPGLPVSLAVCNDTSTHIVTSQLTFNNSLIHVVQHQSKVYTHLLVRCFLPNLQTM